MSNVPQPYTLVVAVDGSEITESVLEHALSLALRHTEHDLHILRVLDTGRRRLRGAERSAALEELDEVLRRDIEYALTSFGDGPEELARWRVRSHVGAGAPEEEIASLAADVRADVIVVGRHGERGRRRLGVGSVPERVLRLARCPVLVVQPTDYGEARESAEACEACVEVRYDSGGERWFCDEHAGAWPWRTSLWRPTLETFSDKGGASLWF